MSVSRKYNPISNLGLTVYNAGHDNDYDIEHKQDENN